MTSVQQTKKQEYETALRVEKKDIDGKVYGFEESLAASIHIHNPSIAKLKLWHGDDGDYYCLSLMNSNSGNQCSIFFKPDELRTLRELLSNA